MIKKSGIRVGITGEMGSGKSTICELFKELGISVYNSDERVKSLQNSNPELREKIISTFGKESYKGGEIDRKYLSNIIFTDAESKGKMMSLIMPYLMEDIAKFDDEHSKDPFYLVETAILFESGWDEMVDYIIYVQVPEPKRIQRCVQRDGITEEEYKLRMMGQISTFIKVTKSDWNIHNFTDSSKKKMVEKIYAELTSD